MSDWGNKRGKIPYIENACQKKSDVKMSREMQP